MRWCEPIRLKSSLALLLLSLVDISRVSASWGGDWGKSEESQLAFEDFHSKNRANRRWAELQRRAHKLGSLVASSSAADTQAYLQPTICQPYSLAQHSNLAHLTVSLCEHSEPFKYTKDDLLIAIPGQTERLSLVEASRPWRSGVNTFVALEKPLKEDEAPKGFLVRRQSCSSLTATPLAAVHSRLPKTHVLTLAYPLLQSKTSEHKEHFGSYEDPHTRSQWEKAGDLRYVCHTSPASTLCWPPSPPAVLL